MNGLARLWRGELPLSDAFWTWAVLGGVAVNLVTSLVFLVLMSVDRPFAAFAAGYGLAVPYNFVAAVGVWRAADRYDGDRSKAEFARIATVVGMVVLSVI